MEFDPRKYGEEIAAILALDGNGERLMPLAGGTCSSAEARRRVNSLNAPPAVAAGLYLYFSCWSEAHGMVDDLSSQDDCYWHAIVHRQEPDPGNSAYWFRQVGKHPIFPDLRNRAAEIGMPVADPWDPFAFINYCESARTHPGSPEERIAREVQLVEWQLLFEWCARSK